MLMILIFPQLTLLFIKILYSLPRKFIFFLNFRKHFLGISSFEVERAVLILIDFAKFPLRLLDLNSQRLFQKLKAPFKVVMKCAFKMDAY